jgi:hypothetical protein
MYLFCIIQHVVIDHHSQDSIVILYQENGKLIRQGTRFKSTNIHLLKIFELKSIEKSCEGLHGTKKLHFLLSEYTQIRD